uniref:Alpha 1,4-glycosyltransferase domain-containing protein n=1 Tax=Phaeomonas parva TaxID=124430 RepID=A0A7S1UDI9_9STRA|mmetsp:Transcript_42148/g.132071  ORF Transcript_42148/g.132071 Transcript_42148/m.132071 type:complete len:379 (+) Transcript_42148:302-1438(+)
MRCSLPALAAGALGVAVVVAVGVGWPMWRAGLAAGMLAAQPPRGEVEHPWRRCIPRLVHQIFLGDEGTYNASNAPRVWARGTQQWRTIHRATELNFTATYDLDLGLDGDEAEGDQGRPGSVGFKRWASKPKRGPKGPWQVVVWNGTTLSRLVKVHYPELAAEYHSYPRWIQRVDLGRFLVLHKYGGIYADVDVAPRKSFKGILDDCPELVIARSDFMGGQYLATDLIAAPPGHPFLDFILHAAAAPVSTASRGWLHGALVRIQYVLLEHISFYLMPYVYTLGKLGPLFFTQAYTQFTRFEYSWPAGAIVILGPGYYTAFNGTRPKLVFHTDGSSWHQWDALLIRLLLPYQVHTLATFACLVVSFAYVFARPRRGRRDS